MEGPGRVERLRGVEEEQHRLGQQGTSGDGSGAAAQSEPGDGLARRHETTRRTAWTASLRTPEVSVSA